MRFARDRRGWALPACVRDDADRVPAAPLDAWRARHRAPWIGAVSHFAGLSSNHLGGPGTVLLPCRQSSSGLEFNNQKSGGVPEELVYGGP